MLCHIVSKLYFFFQIENEYGDVESSYGTKGREYVKWAANMAVGLGAGVPWVMCKQNDAPDFIVSLLELMYCMQLFPFLGGEWEDKID